MQKLGQHYVTSPNFDVLNVIINLLKKISQNHFEKTSMYRTGPLPEVNDLVMLTLTQNAVILSAQIVNKPLGE